MKYADGGVVYPHSRRWTMKFHCWSITAMFRWNSWLLGISKWCKGTLTISAGPLRLDIRWGFAKPTCNYFIQCEAAEAAQRQMLARLDRIGGTRIGDEVIL